ncbi:MAG: collagen-like protein [Mariniphaga sp.]|nr:collagen-like protein [Mariniphaga sp.]
MKKIIGIFLVIAVVIFTACEEVPGPMGPPGMDGESFIGSVFEIGGDFSNSNNYELFYEFPGNFEIYETDVVLVYILWEQVTGSNNENLDVWRALPQTLVLNEGILQYNFDYTLADVKIFLDGDFDFNMLLPAEKDDQIFRIVVFPANYAENNSVDINNLNSVMEFLDIDFNSVQKIDF